MKSPIKLFLYLLFFNHCLNAQTDLLEAIDYQDSSQGVSAAFKSLKVVNFESTKLVSAKELSFSVSHRFGSIKYGFDNFFGLDDAVTRLNFIYGLNSFSNISFSRTSYKKTFDYECRRIGNSIRRRLRISTSPVRNSDGGGGESRFSAPYPRQKNWCIKPIAPIQRPTGDF